MTRSSSPLALRSVIVSSGLYLPKRVLTNTELESMVDTTDEWIVQRTGIRQRHVANETETTSFMATQAAHRALDKAGLTGADIDGVILGTSTPDLTVPGVAVSVQGALGVGLGPCFDVQAACSGFLYALTVADSLIRTGQGRRFLVIGAEKFSSILDWADRRTCVLFGDGAGAVVLAADEGGAGTLEDRGVLKSILHSNGRLRDILRTSGGTASTGTVGHILMDGQEVFRHAVTCMAGAVDEILRETGVDAGAIKWLLPHQANIRIIEAIARKLSLPMDRVIVTLDRHGNTSAASIPLAMAEAMEDGRIQPGDLVLIEAMGAGLSWGAALVRF
ncbi:MAG TPA: beta-ketoacyl-ACP synthase III [Alphaproteobacteria bacterium]|nr:beta-ketoacyl-ACP synthase III [Alphaproteobacteria bacterium]